MTRIFLVSGGLAAVTGVITHSLSSHAIKPFLLERGKLDNFNLAADYLLFHGLAIILVAILCSIYPEAKFHRAGWAFIVGTLFFQVSVLVKACVSISPFGFITPLGGFILIGGWVLLIISAISLNPAR